MLHTRIFNVIIIKRTFRLLARLMALIFNYKTGIRFTIDPLISSYCAFAGNDCNTGEPGLITMTESSRHFSLMNLPLLFYSLAYLHILKIGLMSFLEK